VSLGNDAHRKGVEDVEGFATYLFEIRQQSIPAPLRPPPKVGPPPVVVSLLAAVDLQAVVARTTAEHLTNDHVNGAAVQPCLRNGRDVEVECRVDEAEESVRNRGD